jgi:hypothetical protein
VLTKQINEENAAKQPLSFEDVEASVNMLGNSDLGLCKVHVGSIKSLHAVATETTVVKTSISRAKVVLAKSRWRQILQKLPDIESDAKLEKPLDVNLLADLYQMENY